MNASYTFPVGSSSRWEGPQNLNIPNSYLAQWLLDPGSLTEKLQAHSQTFHLTVIGQRQGEITLEEFQKVCAPKQRFNHADWQVREVLLFGDGQPWVFARSVIPQTLCETDFVNLHNQPLGQLIFNDNRFKRMPFELTHIPQSAAFLDKLHLCSEQDLWGRRSTFQFEGVKMLVGEIFLPSSPAYHLVELPVDG